MKNKTLRLLAISQSVIFLTLLCLTLGNEIIDIPHYVFHDLPTSYPQLLGEIFIELAIFSIIMIVQVLLFKNSTSGSDCWKDLYRFAPIVRRSETQKINGSKWKNTSPNIPLPSFLMASARTAPGSCTRIFTRKKTEPASDKVDSPVLKEGTPEYFQSLI